MIFVVVFFFFVYKMCVELVAANGNVENRKHLNIFNFQYKIMIIWFVVYFNQFYVLNACQTA